MKKCSNKWMIGRQKFKGKTFKQTVFKYICDKCGSIKMVYFGANGMIEREEVTTI